MYKNFLLIFSLFFASNSVAVINADFEEKDSSIKLDQRNRLNQLIHEVVKLNQVMNTGCNAYVEKNKVGLSCFNDIANEYSSNEELLAAWNEYIERD